MSDAKKTGGPAFPYTWVRDGKPATEVSGMTLRDHFAGLAMQGIVAGAVTANFKGESNEDEDEYENDAVAESAYMMADAMLKARGK